MFDQFLKRWTGPIHWHRGPKRGELLGTCHRDLYEHHTEITLSTDIKKMKTGAIIPLRWRTMACLECGEIGLLSQMVTILPSGALEYHLAHFPNDCHYEEQVEVVKVFYDEKLNGIFDSNIPDDWMGMYYEVMNKRLHRFDPTEVR